MIQVVLMDGRKFINRHISLEDSNVEAILTFVAKALVNPEHSIIEISKWKQNNEGSHIPTKKVRHERRRIPERRDRDRPDGLRAGKGKTTRHKNT